MRTYKDGGTVEVYLCNHFITVLDALWYDYKYFQYTFNDMYTEDYVPYHSNYCKDYTPVLQFIHRYNSDGSEAREYQKFKLVSVTICKKQIT